MIVDLKGHVLTCNHVVPEDEVIVANHAGENQPARVIGRDKECDLALLKIKASDAPPVKFGDPASISEGQTVLALGHPLGLEFSISRGIVSSRRRVRNGTTYIQTDVALNPGNSGGPIVNEQGEVIAIADWIIAESKGLGFAVALRHVFAFAAAFRVRLQTASMTAPSITDDDGEDKTE